jgi:hypothetical protein
MLEKYFVNVINYRPMSIFVRIPLGLVVMIVGFLMIKKTDVFFGWFGRIPFAEAKFGQGGTRMFIKLLGVIVVFAGIFIVTNIASDILGSLAGVLTNQ